MKSKKYILLVLLMGLWVSCKKDFLEIKSDKQLVVPATLSDFQALLDNTEVMNTWMPSLGELSSDDYYVKYSDWNTVSDPKAKNAYVWAKDVYEGGHNFPDWGGRYQQVFYANSVLEGLDKIKDIGDRQRYDQIKGSALFYRAYAFYQLAQIFCKPYVDKGDNKDYGIVLRLKSDINLPSVRATVAESYAQIIADLNQALPLLPLKTTYKTRPVQAAALAMLSRVYLSMQDYDQSLSFAEAALSASSGLTDYNVLDVDLTFPMQRYNAEVIFQSTLASDGILIAPRMNVDSILYRAYDIGDLRKAAWFKINEGNISFKGSYDGSSVYFNGLAVDELYLNKSECLARKGNTIKAMEALNDLLEHRFKRGAFEPLKASNPKEALALILAERRKELLFRGLRWTDLRRLNLSPETSKTLSRVLNGHTFVLKPNTLNYVLPIQDDVIYLGKIPQNPRE